MSRKNALRIFRAALDAADPEQAVLRHLCFDGRALRAGRRRYSLSRFDRIRVIGAGKASAAMARAVEKVLGRRIHSGFINIPDGCQARSRHICLNPSGHPIPDRRGLEGAMEIAKIARESTARDLLIVLISGGASALLADPAPPFELNQLQQTTYRLLARGATIQELNTVRKHTSMLKGGELARLAAPATILALILSDVIGDDPSVIGSGPTTGDPSTAEDAARILERYSIPRPDCLRETPKPGDALFGRVQNLIVGSNRLAIDAAAGEARSLGYRPLILSTFIEGESREIAWVHAAIAREIRASGHPARPPVAILSGGETTVTVRGTGTGGRNQEFVLAGAIALENFHATIFSAGTDGIDGPTDAAGAIADETTVSRARALGLDPRVFLAANDSYHFFKRLESLVQTGPTGTNVMDVRILLVD